MRSNSDNTLNRRTLLAVLASSGAVSTTGSLAHAEPIGFDTAPAAASALEAGFRTPPEEAKPYTLWHWMNGVVDCDGITADLESFKQAGLGGVQMFLVGGSEAKIDDPTNPILSEKWKGLFKHAIEECARLGLKFGTHNSPGWSSTGFKAVQPKDSMQKVVFTEQRVEGGKTFEGVLKQPETNHGYYDDIVCWAIRDGQTVSPSQAIDLSDRLASDGRLTWTAPAGQWVIVRIGHTAIGKINLTAPVSGQGLEVDKLNAVPLKAYWDTFPAELLAIAGDHAGKTFVRFEIDSYEMGPQNWTSIMPAEFQRRRGYDIRPFLLTITGRTVENQDASKRFDHDWRATQAELFNENYFQAMRALIHRAPGMKLLLEPYGTGPGAPFEPNNAGAAADLAMCEFWQKPTPWGWDSIKPVVSGVHTWGKTLVAAEAFTGQPNSAWRVDPYALKSTGDRAFAEGVNQLFFHTSAHQPWKAVLPGMTMGQWGTHFGRTQTWWTHGAAEWIQYLTRCQFLLQQGRPVADLLYLAYDGRTPKPPAGYWADTIGTDAFLTRLSVENGDLILPNGVRYKVLILPDTPVMRPDVAVKLAALANAGARIIGPPPTTSPGLSDRAKNDGLVAAVGQDLWAPDAPFADRIRAAQDIEQALRAFKIAPDLSVVAADCPKPLLWIHRRSEEADVYFLSNQTDLPTIAQISLPGLGRLPELWWPDAGRIEAAPYHFVEGERRHIKLALPPSGSVFIVLRHQAARAITISALTSPSASDVHSTVSGADLIAAENGAYVVTFSDRSRKSVTVRGLAAPFVITSPWTLTFADKPQGATDRTLARLVSWTQFEDEARFYSGTATYRTRFAFPHRRSSDTAFLLDLGEVANTARVVLNGQDLGTLWKPPFTIDLAPALASGLNSLEVEVTNLWANRMIGDERFPDDLSWAGKSLAAVPKWVQSGGTRPEPRRKTFATYKFFDGQEALLPSGLMGPVQIRSLKRVPLG